MATERLRLYSYATAPEAASYVAIMRLFAEALLAEWSAHDLAERGIDLPTEVIDQRLRYLEQNGNLLASPREVRVTSIAEYQRQPARYTATSLGLRVHRQVEEVLAAAGGAREVPRELLAAVAHRLTALAFLTPEEIAASDPAVMAETVSTVFLQFEAFAGAVTDFYSYVGSVLARADLDDEEWLGFKHLLLDYLETIVESVTRHTAAIRLALDRLQPRLPTVVERAAAAAPALEALRAASPGGEGVERARGRSVSDWIELRAWFGAPGDRMSGSAQLRAAATRAVGALLANVKRMNAASSRETSLRRHFLRLAAWFDAAPPDDAHVLYTSAFALYGARHLGIALDPDIAEALPATTSWWRAPGAPVPLSIRERGDRTPRGRVVRVADHGAQKERLAAERRREAEQREQAVAELLAVGDRLHEVRLSSPAFQVLVELLGQATARFGPDLAGASAALIDAGVVLWVQPTDAVTRVRSTPGDLSVEGFRLTITTAGRRPASPIIGVAEGMAE
ncbi:MAG: TIGR02677 family protein [Actinomycetota bacterium]|nr:TIGR02677 family protein [Actinomycetota bacterium]